MTDLADADIAQRLRDAGVPSPASDARWLREALGRDTDALEEAVARRCRREPLQLILGEWDFRHLTLQMARGVFIPRPETELLAGLAIDRVPGGGTVIEPCTGTGAIACALADESGAGRIIATDVNAAAVDLARRNAARFPQVEVHHASLLAGIDLAMLGQVDVIVCNPPYLDPSQLADAEPEVRDHDPVDALVGGESGWEVIADLVAAAGHWLRPGGWILIEDDPSRVDQTVQALDADVGPAHVERDLAGRPRFALARAR